MYWNMPDPFALVRRLVSRKLGEMLDRTLAVPGRAAEAAAASVRSSVHQRSQELMTLLGQLPHGVANAVADSYRGPHARPLTAHEKALVAEAFGARVDAGKVRIVRGCGLSAFAQTAFWNGNPAITIGNTIYLSEATYDKTPGDMSTKEIGVELLLHEFTHVVQYASLGFARFGTTYSADLNKHGYEARKLYDHKNRALTYGQETLEGQAEMVGNYAAGRASLNTAKRTVADRVKPKLHGTGIYGY